MKPDGAGRRAMRLLLGAGLVLALASGPQAVVAKPGLHPHRELEVRLLGHMRVLASDKFGGREPGTDGEAKSLDYIARAWFGIGLVSGTNDPGHAWFAPVTLVAREPVVSTAQFQRGRRLMTVGDDDVLVLTSGRRGLIEGAPLYFVGHGGVGAAVPPRTELAGRVAVLLDKPPAVPAGADGASPQDSSRQNALLAGGALAVITVLDGPRNLASVAARRKRQGYALADEALGGDLEAFITAAAMDRLLMGGGTSLVALEGEADGRGFSPHLLDLTASLEATTRETVIHTHNVIGKLPGRKPGSGAVLVTAHWDHFGTCAQPPAEHLICNGAIDNASGVAGLIEIARRLAHPPAGTPPLDRDVYFVATTGEELGLLGAEAFAENPPLPLSQVVAAFNLDSIAIAPSGTPLGIVGKGMTGLDAGIAEVAREQGRRLNTSTAPNAYIARQDGWALMHHDVPAVMVSSAYGEIWRLEHFFDTDYHRPSDVVKPGIELGGAAEDVLFTAALVRHFADLRKVPAAK